MVSEHNESHSVTHTPKEVLDRSFDSVNNLLRTGGGVQSVGNSTTAELGGGATFTGPGEQSPQPSVGVMLLTDAAGTLFFDFSGDGSNWDSTFPTAGFAVAANIPEFHVAVKLGRYFRVRLVNGAGAQSFMRLFTYFGEFGPPNAPVHQSIGADADAATVRVASDHRLDLARLFIGGQSEEHIVGENPDIGASSTELIAFGGVDAFLTVATTVRIKAGNAADTSDGNGARTVTVYGLDENWAEVSETLTLAGESASSATTVTFIRIRRIEVATSGTYSTGVGNGANTADVVLENGSGGTDIITMPAGEGVSQSAHYTTPAGKTGYLQRYHITVDANKEADVKMFKRENADDTSAPVSPKVFVTGSLQLKGVDQEVLEALPSFPPMTDIWWEGSTGSGAEPAIEVDYDIILVDD